MAATTKGENGESAHRRSSLFALTLLANHQQLTTCHITHLVSHEFMRLVNFTDFRYVGTAQNFAVDSR